MYVACVDGVEVGDWRVPERDLGCEEAEGGGFCAGDGCGVGDYVDCWAGMEEGGREGVVELLVVVLVVLLVGGVIVWGWWVGRS